MTVRILEGDVRAIASTLETNSVDMIVSSPPYFGLRDYGTAEWVGGSDPACDHVVGAIRTGLGMAALGAKHRGGGQKASEPKPLTAKDQCPRCGARRVDDQIGLEATPAEYVATIVDTFRQLRRALRAHGTLWLNLGDSYANDTKCGGSTSGKHATALKGNTGIGRRRHKTGFKSKDLMGIPWMVAAALRAGWARCSGCDIERRADLWPLHNGHLTCIDCLLAGRTDAKVRQSEPGWYLRQELIWAKPNPMPESVRDRCTKAHEHIFLLAKSGDTLLWRARDTREWAWTKPDLTQTVPTPTDDDPDHRSPRWHGFDYYFDADAISEGLTESSIERLSQPNIAQQLGSDRLPGKTNGRMKAVGKMVGANGPDRPSKGVPNGAARRGMTPRHTPYTLSCDQSGLDDVPKGRRNKRSVWTVATVPFKESHYAVFPPKLIEPCIRAGCPEGGTVLDPFGGAGTTALVCERIAGDRNTILIELSSKYSGMARARVYDDAPLFTDVA